MERKELKETAHSMIDQLSNRQLEAIVKILGCFTGYDESESVPEADGGEGIPPANIFGKFFS